MTEPAIRSENVERGGGQNAAHASMNPRELTLGQSTFGALAT